MNKPSPFWHHDDVGGVGSILHLMDVKNMKTFISFLVLVAFRVIAFDVPSIFPVSTRQALIKKSEEICDTAGYSSAGFSNRRGLVLTPLALNPGVYGADRPFLWNNIDVMGRMVVIELPSGKADRPDLWVHSPVALDGPLQKAIDSIGNVKHIVSPNYEHVKYAGQWKQAYPDAELWGCPGLTERKSEWGWTGEIPQGYRPKGFNGAAQESTPLSGKMWDSSQIETLHVDVEVNPFTGKPFFNECVFYHRPSKSFITTDLFWNYPASTVPNSQYGQDDTWELAPVVDEIPLGSKLWKFGMDKVYLPFFDNFMVQDKSAYNAIVKHIIDAWDVDMVVPAHGDILRGNQLIRKALSEFLGYV